MNAIPSPTGKGTFPLCSLFWDSHKSCLPDGWQKHASLACPHPGPCKLPLCWASWTCRPRKQAVVKPPGFPFPSFAPGGCFAVLRPWLPKPLRGASGAPGTLPGPLSRAEPAHKGSSSQGMGLVAARRQSRLPQPNPHEERGREAGIFKVTPGPQNFVNPLWWVGCGDSAEKGSGRVEFPIPTRGFPPGRRSQEQGEYVGSQVCPKEESPALQTAAVPLPELRSGWGNARACRHPKSADTGATHSLVQQWPVSCPQTGLVSHSAHHSG